MAPDVSLQYRAVSGLGRYWRSWGEETVVYNERSGDTHLFGRREAAAIESLRQIPADVPQLAARVAAVLNLEVDDDFLHYIEALVSELENLGVVEWVRQ